MSTNGRTVLSQVTVSHLMSADALKHLELCPPHRWPVFSRVTVSHLMTVGPLNHLDIIS